MAACLVTPADRSRRRAARRSAPIAARKDAEAMSTSSPSRPARIIAVVNQKGGCGKTTTAINLAAVLARAGERTLLVDMDPQSHCAAGLGIPESRVEFGLAQALAMDPVQVEAEALLWEVSRQLWLAPSTVDLAAFEATTGGPDRDRRLDRLLARVGDGFEWCIVDCPPTLGLLTFNALRACHEAVVPVETGYFSLRGAERQVATVRAVASRLGRSVPLRLLPSMHREGTKVAQEVLASLTRRFPDLVIPVVVREHEVLREAASFGQAIVEYAPESPAHEDFRQLVEWLRRNPPAPGAVDAMDAVLADQVLADDAPPDSDPPPHAAATASTRAAELVARMRRTGTPTPSEPSHESVP